MMIFSAFLPSRILFSYFWSQAFEILRDEEDFLNYFKENQVFFKDGHWVADWQCNPSKCVYGFSTYLPNSIESFWGQKVKIAMIDLTGVSSLTKHFAVLIGVVHTWYNDKEWANCVMFPNHANVGNKYIIGDGILSYKFGGMSYGRRLTLSAIKAAAARGDWHIRRATADNNIWYIMPKYNQDDFQEAKMNHLLDTVVCSSTFVEVRQHLESLEIIIDGKFEWTLFRDAYMKFSIVRITPTSLQDYHLDGRIGGVTAHELWVELQEGYQVTGEKPNYIESRILCFALPIQDFLMELTFLEK